MSQDPKQPQASWGLVASLLIIFAGVVLLFDQLGVLPPRFVHTFWPLIFVVAGGARVYTADRHSDRIVGGLLVFFGVIVTLNNMGFRRITADIIWPLIIIGVGVSMLWHVLERQKLPEGVPSQSKFDLFYCFGGGEHRIETQKFQGGRLFSICGGYKIDLSHADIDGAIAMLEADAIFGGGEIRVPESWRVVVQGRGMFGGYSDQTRHIPKDPTVPAKSLLVQGFALFGGIVVKN